VDLSAVADACRQQAQRPTAGIGDMAAYLDQQVDDDSHREVLGPLLDGSGASGCVLHAGREIAAWGDPDVPEMTYSATKSFIALVAGVAFDRGLLRPEQPVAEVVDLDELRHGAARSITWEHLLQQTSQWQGTLWGKPADVDAQSFREGDEVHGVPPGAGWAYNDVRINLLTLALTALLGSPLDDVLSETILVPLGASSSWSWHGYSNSTLDVGGRALPVVSGGAHWGGGLFISARDMALVGQLHLDAGAHRGEQLVSREWMERTWTPCAVKPEYGYLWWLNDTGKVWPGAPTTGRCARGNGGRHLLWVDPARDLVVASHWGDDVTALVQEVSAAVTRHL
jgi:CubicO group peptidase (beta-lactamase class C family)